MGDIGAMSGRGPGGNGMMKDPAICVGVDFIERWTDASTTKAMSDAHAKGPRLVTGGPLIRLACLRERSF